jgi:hypothetical protein
MGSKLYCLPPPPPPQHRGRSSARSFFGMGSKNGFFSEQSGVPLKEKAFHRQAGVTNGI